MLRRSGFVVNHKRIYRILRTLDLMVPRRRKQKRLFALPSKGIPDAAFPGEVWSIDFVFDRLTDGSSFRCFTIIDNLTREVPGIHISKSMAGFTPVDYLESLRQQGKIPKHIILDNGTEFVNEVFINWAAINDVSLHFIDPGKPVQNAYIESFNGKFRAEFLSQKKFGAVAEVRTAVTEWLRYYNEVRPHSSLDYFSPKEFAAQAPLMLDKKINSLVLKTG